MLLTSILKRKQSWLKTNPVIDCLSDESTLSFESDVNEDTNIIKTSTSPLEISLFSDFDLYVGYFKMNHENDSIIITTFSSTML